MGKGEYLHRGHTVTDIKYHFVWVTKYRYPVLTDVVPGVKYLCAMTTIRNVHRKRRRIVGEGGWLWETRRGFSKACGKVAEGQLSIGRQAPDRGVGSPRGEGYVFHRQPPSDHDFSSSVDLAAAA